MIILIDMDDVIADFDGEFYAKWCLKYPHKQIAHPDHRTKFYIKDESPPEYRDLIYSLCSENGFIRSLPEIPGAVNALKQIKKLGNSVFICTSPLLYYENNVLEKYLWVEEHLGRNWTENIILTRDKTIVRGDILIDDKPEITGHCTPVWEHILFDRSYNRHIKGKKRMTWKNWKEVLGFNLKK